MRIPEIDTPKTKSITFKCSDEEKEIIEKFCKSKNFRVSAFCRVACMLHIKKDKKKGKK